MDDVIGMQLRCYLRGQGLRVTPLTLALGWRLMLQGFSPKQAARYVRLDIEASLA